MHDILEGVLQYIVKELLKEFIFEKRYFKLDDLNKRMRAFDFGYHNDTNKPAPIQAQRLLSSDNSLKQHANQMWCLGLHLPFLIGDLIEVDDQHWGLLCTLLQIVRISFTPIVSREQVSYLQILIQKLLQNFKELFPECSIIPKMHYMVHMPRAILQFGPLVRSWCMRYEAKHHYFKRLAIVIGNFINLPYSLAKRHQEGVCYRLQSAEGGNSTFICKGTEIGPATVIRETYVRLSEGKTLYVGDVEESGLIRTESPEVNRQTPLYSTKWITINGTKYKVGATVHIGYDDVEFPQFWEVIGIYIINQNVANAMFVVSRKQTVRFSEHYQAYEVAQSKQKEIKIKYFKELTSHLPFNLIKPFGCNTKYICHRYEIDVE
ncbi:uncharacterized protein LOC124446617 isoform X2 [Xenia sp. Carnegie-2017]|uniref:uncharacterized protein LOC124446617 isoform X2 n=1 Tax=Xenia sp. Carnegie-2017 TaxID=2897299 RepID=UPI001F0437FF|nr:uncharacterized protein LOC124446617 isoform X2 [Xenia sp. Carnegie-2017]